MNTMMRYFTVLVFVVLAATTSYAQITSAGSGNWSSTSTWVGGNVPTSADDVVIAATHVVAVDNASAECKNISFGDAAAKLDMSTAGSMLSVYGNFTIASTTHQAFSNWTDGAIVKFTGSAIQTLSGWSTSGSSTSIMEIIVDKSGGKVVTSGANMRFSFGTSLEIINGTFELAALDDIECRNLSNTGTSATITIQSNGTFTMAGVASPNTSYIRKGTFTGEDTKKIGKMTVYGTVNFANGSTTACNFIGIDIESGGVVTVPSGVGVVANTFNPGAVTIKNGGKFVSGSTVNYWYANGTTATTVIINSGGEYEFLGSLIPTMPQVFTNNGIVRFSNSGNQTLPASITTYQDLILSNSGTKTLGGDITVNGTLSQRGSANLALGGFSLIYGALATLQYGGSGQTTAQTTTDVELPASGGPNNISIFNSSGVTLHGNRTLNGTLTLSAGVFDNNGSGDDINLTLGNGALIRRATGSLSVPPVFGSSVDIDYISTVTHVTTGNELPTSTSVLNNLTLSGDEGITLGSHITVNGILSFTNTNNINTDVYTLTIASDASITGETTGRYVVGNLLTTQSVGTGASTLGGVGVSLASGADNLGNVTVTRVTGANGIVTANANTGIARKWTIVSDNAPSSGRDITFSWISSDDNSKTLTSGTSWKSTDAGTTWSQQSSGDFSSRSVSLTSQTSFGQYTISDGLSPLPVELTSFTASVNGKNVTIHWTTATETNNHGFEIERKEMNQSTGASMDQWVNLGFVEGAGTSNAPRSYSFIDASASGAVEYRLKQVDRDGSFSYSATVEANISLSPGEYALHQNFPNPFNPATVIRFAVPKDQHVTVKVINLLGQEVRTLFDGMVPGGEMQNVNFDASNLSAGVYYYSMKSAGTTEVKKMLLLK
jgi:hypothetical protein